MDLKIKDIHTISNSSSNNNNNTTTTSNNNTINSARSRSSSIGPYSPSGSRFIRLMNHYKELEIEWWNSISEEDKELLQEEGLDTNNMLFFSEVLFTVAHFKPMMMFSYLPESMLQSYYEKVIHASGLLQTIPDIVFKKCKSIETNNTLFENTAVLYFKQSIKQYQQNILNNNNQQPPSSPTSSSSSSSSSSSTSTSPTKTNNNNNQNNSCEDEIVITATSPRSLSSSPSLNIKQMFGQLSQSSISLLQSIDELGETSDLTAKEVDLAELFDYPTSLPEHIKGDNADQFYDVGYSCKLNQSTTTTTTTTTSPSSSTSSPLNQSNGEMDEDERIIMSYFIPRHQLHMIQDRIKQHHHTYATLFKIVFNLELKLRIAPTWDD